jgi:hypothetical protein
VAQDRAGELGEEALDEIEPGTMLGCEGEFEAVKESPRIRSTKGPTQLSVPITEALSCRMSNGNQNAYLYDWFQGIDELATFRRKNREPVPLD